MTSLRTGLLLVGWWAYRAGQHRHALHRATALSSSPITPLATREGRGAQALRWHTQLGLQAWLLDASSHKYGVCYIGGTTAGTVSLHRQQDGVRIAKVKPETLGSCVTPPGEYGKGRALFPSGINPGVPWRDIMGGN